VVTCSALFHHRHIKCFSGEAFAPWSHMAAATAQRIGSRGLADASLKKPLEGRLDTHTAGTPCPPRLKTGEADDWRGFGMGILGIKTLREACLWHRRLAERITALRTDQDQLGQLVVVEWHCHRNWNLVQEIQSES
jgi:hypothetical protein